MCVVGALPCHPLGQLIATKRLILLSIVAGRQYAMPCPCCIFPFSCCFLPRKYGKFHVGSFCFSNSDSFWWCVQYWSGTHVKFCFVQIFFDKYFSKALIKQSAKLVVGIATCIFFVANILYELLLPRTLHKYYPFTWNGISHGHRRSELSLHKYNFDTFAKRFGVSDSVNFRSIRWTCSQVSNNCFVTQ